MRSVRRLRDTDLASINFREDIRGHSVNDAQGRHVGLVEWLFLDEDRKKIRFFSVVRDDVQRGDGEVSAGDHNRPATVTFCAIVPIDAVVDIAQDAVRLDRREEQLVTVPSSDSMPTTVLDWDAIYRQYGYAPFWNAGYVYPPYPFYM